MLRAIHLFPKLEDSGRLSAFRNLHDPLASCIAPHVTLVFPFESPLSDAELVAHVAHIGGATLSFRVEFGNAESHDGGIWHDGSVIWLPVTVGADAVTKLHDELYAGPLADHLNRSHAYRPHMTIGRVTHEKTEILAAVDEAGEDFWVNLPAYEWVPELVSTAIRQGEGVSFLTSCGRFKHAHVGKIRWLKKHGILTSHTDVILSHRKFLHAGPRDVLVDDYPVYLDRWAEDGGIPLLVSRVWNGYKGHNEADVLAQLKL